MNRNGLIGDFDTFKPIRLGMDELIARARQAKDAAPAERVSKVISREQGWSLVRYRLASDELLSDLRKLDGHRHDTGSDRPDEQAMFGVLDEAGEPHLVLHVLLDPDPQISFVSHGDVPTLSGHQLVEFLRQIDCPASWRAGADLQLADRFDVRWDKVEGLWEVEEPRHVVKVAFDRMCFGTRPSLTETIDVFLTPSAHHDLADADPEKAYWAKNYYRERAWGEFHRLPSAEHVRPGFSSWMNSGEPVLVKVLNTSLDKEIARLVEEQSEIDSSRPAPSA